MEVIYKNAFFQLINFLEKMEKDKGIKYYLVGGILTSIYSETRSTHDIDFVVDLFSANLSLNNYISLLSEYEFFPFQDWITTMNLARQTKMLQYLDKQERINLDNYIIDKADKSKYKRIGPIALKRRVKVEFADIKCWATSKEDFIISKLVLGGWQDYTDALGCWMRFNDLLDILYMNKISKELGVQKEYELLKSGIDDPDDYFKQINGY
ncbi:MAG: hypothetical protein CEE42_00395 [Promethearchaeota archaeon Loki_b31]|nr:MAG: hypothetical protein CEE42_00395 [Candidatus Lokiarchaeota archaeon Loki_b31]